VEVLGTAKIPSYLIATLRRWTQLLSLSIIYWQNCQ